MIYRTSDSVIYCGNVVGKPEPCETIYSVAKRKTKALSTRLPAAAEAMITLVGPGGSGIPSAAEVTAAAAEALDNGHLIALPFPARLPSPAPLFTPTKLWGDICILNLQQLARSLWCYAQKSTLIAFLSF